MNRTFFVPQLYIPAGIKDIGFYQKAFDAVLERQWLNDDGSIHVAELSIDGALFHLHERTERVAAVEPAKNGETTVMIGLFVEDVHALMKQAVNAGAIVINSVQDYDYGYRQGELKDPFGHLWMIEKKI